MTASWMLSNLSDTATTTTAAAAASTPFHTVTLTEMALRLGGITVVMIGVLYLTYFLMKKYPLFQQSAQLQISRWAGVDLPALDTPQASKTHHTESPKNQKTEKPSLQWVSVAKSMLSPKESTKTPTSQETFPTMPTISDDTIRITHQTAINSTQQLMIAHIQGEQFLLASTPEHVTCLSPLKKTSLANNGIFSSNLSKIDTTDATEPQAIQKFHPLPVNYSPTTENHWQTC